MVDNRYNLISTTNLVQVPQVIVKIGNYEFGTFSKIGKYSQYPNYVQNLSVVKINGQINKYTLNLIYLITEYNDPNFFEAVFSSVSSTRKIFFTYGDCAQKNFMYKKEEAIITGITSNFATDGAKIEYNVTAVSTGSLAASGTYNFPARFAKPSDVLYELLKDNGRYGLQDIFTGMRSIALCQQRGLIPTDDLAVALEGKTNISILDYMQYLVDNMTSGVPKTGVAKDVFYVIKYLDDVSNIFQGSYFQVVKVDANIKHPEAYQLDYGYPGTNLARDLRIEKGENYSIYYDYQKQLHPLEYVSRINDVGEYEEVYAPILSSGNERYYTRNIDRTWWSKVSQFPLKASLTVKGLLRPALLMSYLRLNIVFFGKKHIASGLYIITKQQDLINEAGFSTSLDMVKIAEDEG